MGLNNTNSDFYNRSGRSYQRMVRIAESQNYKCFYCETRMIVSRLGRANSAHIPSDYATIEHVIPRCAGGSSKKGNLVAVHSRCNHKLSAIWNHSLIHAGLTDRKLKLNNGNAARSEQLDRERLMKRLMP